MNKYKCLSSDFGIAWIAIFIYYILYFQHMNIQYSNSVFTPIKGNEAEKRKKKPGEKHIAYENQKIFKA